MEVRITLDQYKHWTGRKKAEAVLDLIKGRVLMVDFCRSNDLKQSEVEKWMDDFLKAGTQGLRSNANEKLSEKDKQITELQQVVCEQALQIRALKKSIEIAGRDENES
jgi:transposase-like protein